MKKKMFMVLTVILSAMFLSACSGEGVSLKVTGDGVDINAGDSSLSVSGDGVDINSGDNSVSNNNGNNDNSNNNNSNNNSNNSSNNNNNPSNNNSSNNVGIKDKLIPPGATVFYSTEGSMVLSSNMSTQELISFYTKALNSLGAKESSSQTFGGLWDYDGTYNGGKDISIQIAGGVINIDY
jgi:hypothetical protein